MEYHVLAAAAASYVEAAAAIQVDSVEETMPNSVRIVPNRMHFRRPVLLPSEQPRICSVAAGGSAG